MNLKDFTNLKVWKAFLLQLIVPILVICNSGVWLNSISAYANYTPLAFGALLTTAALLFFEDGFVHRERRHNITIGLALFFIMILNHSDYPITHYIFAIYFFVGSQVFMIWKSSKEQRWWKVLISVGVNIAGVLCFIFNLFSILTFEWIAMLPMSVHFAGETKNKIN